MELDKRILPGKRPLTCFDTEEAKKFIGEKGYFNHNLSRFCYLKNCTPAYLRNIFAFVFVAAQRTFSIFVRGRRMCLSLFIAGGTL